MRTPEFELWLDNFVTLRVRFLAILLINSLGVERGLSFD